MVSFIKVAVVILCLLSNRTLSKRVGLHHGAHVEVREQSVAVGSLLPGFCRLNSDCQAYGKYLLSILLAKTLS